MSVPGNPLPSTLFVEKGIESVYCMYITTDITEGNGRVVTISLKLITLLQQQNFLLFCKVFAENGYMNEKQNLELSEKRMCYVC